MVTTYGHFGSDGVQASDWSVTSTGGTAAFLWVARLGRATADLLNAPKAISYDPLAPNIQVTFNASIRESGERIFDIMVAIALNDDPINATWLGGWRAIENDQVVNRAFPATIDFDDPELVKFQPADIMVATFDDLALITHKIHAMVRTVTDESGQVYRYDAEIDQWEPFISVSADNFAPNESAETIDISTQYFIPPAPYVFNATLGKYVRQAYLGDGSESIPVRLWMENRDQGDWTVNTPIMLQNWLDEAVELGNALDGKVGGRIISVIDRETGIADSSPSRLPNVGQTYIFTSRNAFLFSLESIIGTTEALEVEVFLQYFEDDFVLPVNVTRSITKRSNKFSYDVFSEFNYTIDPFIRILPDPLGTWHSGGAAVIDGRTFPPLAPGETIENVNGYLQDQTDASAEVIVNASTVELLAQPIGTDAGQPRNQRQPRANVYQTPGNCTPSASVNLPSVPTNVILVTVNHPTTVSLGYPLIEGMVATVNAPVMYIYLTQGGTIYRYQRPVIPGAPQEEVLDLLPGDTVASIPTGDYTNDLFTIPTPIVASGTPGGSIPDESTDIVVAYAYPSPNSAVSIIEHDIAGGLVEQTDILINDPDAIHRSIPNEFGLMPQKSTLVNSDRFMGEDSQNGFSPFWVTLTDLLAQASGSISLTSPDGSISIQADTPNPGDTAIQVSSVDGSKIVDFSIPAEAYEDQSVGNAALALLAIATGNVQNGAITAAKAADGIINVAAKIVNGIITKEKLDPTIFNNLVRHRGEWQPDTTYGQGLPEVADQVLSDGWTGITLAQTMDNPAPQPVGERAFIKDTIGGFNPGLINSQTEPSIYIVHEYTFAEDYEVSKISWQLAPDNIGDTFSVGLVTDPRGAPASNILFPRTTATSFDVDDRREFNVSPVIIPAGLTFHLLLRIIIGTSPATFSGNWLYRRNNGDPDLGQVCHAGGGNSFRVRVHETDENSNNRSADLDTLVPGSSYVVGGIPYTISQINPKSGSVYEFIVDNDTRASDGQSYNIVFSTPPSETISYIENDDFYLSYPAIRTGVFTSYDPGTISITGDNGYGLDLELQQVVVSDDYELIGVPSGGSGVGGGSASLPQTRTTAAFNAPATDGTTTVDVSVINSTGFNGSTPFAGLYLRVIDIIDSTTLRVVNDGGVGAPTAGQTIPTDSLVGASVGQPGQDGADGVVQAVNSADGSISSTGTTNVDLAVVHSKTSIADTSGGMTGDITLSIGDPVEQPLRPNGVARNVDLPPESVVGANFNIQCLGAGSLILRQNATPIGVTLQDVAGETFFAEFRTSGNDTIVRAKRRE